MDCSLRKLIDDGIDPAKVPKLLTTELAGVEAAHKQNIWHRDLKAENLLYDKRSDALVIADFGTLLSKSTPLQEATFKLLGFNPSRVQ